MNDVSYKLSGNDGFINVNVKEECSSNFLIYSKIEGNLAFHLCSMLYFVRYNSFILLKHVFCIHLVPISQAVAHLNLFTTMKMSLTWRMNLLRLVTAFCECAQVVTNIIEIFDWKWICTVTLFLVLLSQRKCMSFMDVSDNLPVWNFISFILVPTPISCFFKVYLNLQCLLKNIY